MHPRIGIGSPIQWAGNTWHVARLTKTGAKLTYQVAGRTFSQDVSLRQLEKALPKRK